jgi:V/A-type H+-transporting ATPase subunit D
MDQHFKRNKQELTKFKRQEKLLHQYLPMLKLKQEQLQLEVNKNQKKIFILQAQIESFFIKLSTYFPCLLDPLGPKLEDLVQIDDIVTAKKRVAGIVIPVLTQIRFKDVTVGYFYTPPWVFLIRPNLNEYIDSCIALKFLTHEQQLLRTELKKATQKFNLFEKVMIPHNKMAIKKIKLALDDEQVAGVIRGKIAKNKRLNLNNHGALMR